MATVLVAEDDRDILALMVHKLERSGHRVVTATDGLTALARARDERPDLALIDVGMPGMTGLDVCRALRASAETASLPVILVTVHATTAAVEEGLSAGADDYIVKPFSPSHLMSRVEALLGRYRAWEQAGLLAGIATLPVAPDPAGPAARRRRRRGGLLTPSAWPPGTDRPATPGSTARPTRLRGPGAAARSVPPPSASRRHPSPRGRHAGRAGRRAG